MKESVTGRLISAPVDGEWSAVARGSPAEDWRVSTAFRDGECADELGLTLEETDMGRARLAVTRADKHPPRR